jgi:transcriptional regulator with XRE-family HTH domain
MANERLRSTIVAAGKSLGDLADEVGVDPKTIERWITLDRVPHRRNRFAVARALGTSEEYLWPDAARSEAATKGEFVTFYPHRGAVPGNLWFNLATRTVDAIDILVYAGLFLWDGGPDLPTVIRKRAEEGTAVRLLLGNPDSDAVARRGEEEGIDEGMAARIRISLAYLKETTLGTPGLELRLHSTTLYNSIYRFDGDVLVNAHVYGAGAAHNPVMHFRSLPGGRMVRHYLSSFDRVWASAIPFRPA